MIGYKVVYVQGDDLVSAVALGSAQVKYVPGEETQAPEYYAKRGYHLLVFNTLVTAKLFACGRYDVEIWRARADGLLSGLPSARRVKADPDPEPFGGLAPAWPVGTLMARTVTLLDKVWSSKGGEG